MPQTLTHFHKLWHESQTGRPTQFFGKRDLDPELAQLLHVVAALRAVPSVTARTEFVKDLRERLMAETLIHAGRSPSAATAAEEIVGRSAMTPVRLRPASHVDSTTAAT